MSKKIAVIDIETTGLSATYDRIVAVGATLLDGTYIEFDLVEDSKCEKDLVEFLLAHDLCGHNIKFDVNFINKQFDLELEPYIDTMFVIYLLHPYFKNLKLKHLSQFVLGKKYSTNENTLKLTDINGKVPKEIAAVFHHFDNPYFDKKEELKMFMMKYLKEDVMTTLQLLSYISKLTKKEVELAIFLTKLDFKIATKFEPMYIDKEELEEVYEETTIKIDEMLKIMRKNNKTLNLNSPKQVTDHITYVEGMKIRKKTKSGGLSASADSLQTLLEENPENEFIKTLMDYRKVSHLHKSFYKPWLGQKTTDDGRLALYPRFSLCGTVSGRTSCKGPNIQQIPRGSDRKMFKPPEGFDFVEVDYSQMELRIAAEVMDIDAIQKAYNNNEDLHDKTTIALFGKEDFTKEERGVGKTSNFGLLYGMGIMGYRDFVNGGTGSKITFDEAKKLRESFYNLYPEINVFIEKIIGKLNANELIQSPTGRVYRWDNLAYNTSPTERGKIQRSCVNSQVQGYASDLLLFSLDKILSDERYGKDFYVCGTVHDSVLMYIKKGVDVYEKINDYMTNHDVKIPLKIDFENFGDSWQ